MGLCLYMIYLVQYIDTFFCQMVIFILMVFEVICNMVIFLVNCKFFGQLDLAFGTGSLTLRPVKNVQFKYFLANNMKVQFACLNLVYMAKIKTNILICCATRHRTSQNGCFISSKPNNTPEFFIAAFQLFNIFYPVLYTTQILSLKWASKTNEILVMVSTYNSML